MATKKVDYRQIADVKKRLAVEKINGEISRLSTAIEELKKDLNIIIESDLKESAPDDNGTIRISYLGIEDSTKEYTYTQADVVRINNDFIQKSDFYARICEFADTFRDKDGVLKYPRSISKECIADYRTRHPNSKIDYTQYIEVKKSITGRVKNVK